MTLHPTLFQTLTPGVLTIGVYTAFAPVCSKVGDAACGWDIDFLQRFATHLGLTLEICFFPFAGLWERPGRDEVDIAASGIAPLSSRNSPGVVWSDSYFTIQRSLLVRASDQATLKTIGDFAHRIIAVTRGSTAEVDTLQRKPASTRVVYYDDQNAMLRDLLNGTIDSYGTGHFCSVYFAEQHPAQLAVADVHEMALPETFSFAVRAAGGLLAPLNKFIGEHGAQYGK